MRNRIVLVSPPSVLCASVCGQQQPSKIKNDIPAITRKALPAVGLILVPDSGCNHWATGGGLICKGTHDETSNGTCTG
jgi:hypothetical protein